MAVSAERSSPPPGPGSQDPADCAFHMEEEDEDDDEALDVSVSPSEPSEETAPKRCVFSGCSEISAQGAKQRKPWMCKKHRNKMYKDKYKKKKSEKTMASGKLEEGSEERPVSVIKQRLGSVGERPARPTLIEQVLNQKRLSLLRSPEVISFLQQQQHLLSIQTQSSNQQKY